MIPDIEKLITKHLKADTDVAAITQRIVGKPPDDHGTPWVRVSQLNAPTGGDDADHLIPFFVQFDCYADAPGGNADEGGGQPVANLLGRTVRAAVRTMREADFSTDQADVTDVVIMGDSRIPDTAFEPALERRIVTATIYAHSR